MRVHFLAVIIVIIVIIVIDEAEKTCFCEFEKNLWAVARKLQ